MSDPVKRILAWEAKFNTERVKQTLDAQLERMRERYCAATVELCAMEHKTKQVLDLSGIHTVLYVPYLDFARQLFRLSRVQTISGNSAAKAAQVLLDKWSARGLDPAVLASIRTQVFDIGTPAP